MIAFIFAGLVFSFSAFCVWLTVRLVNRRKKTGWLILAGLVPFIALVAYPLSFGPACLLMDAGILPRSKLKWVFRPILDRALEGSDARMAYEWAVKCGGETAYLSLQGEYVGETF
jgi:hypothetical protein